MTTTPNEPVQDPDVIPTDDPERPGQDPGSPEEPHGDPLVNRGAATRHSRTRPGPAEKQSVEEPAGEPGQMPASTDTEVGA